MSNFQADLKELLNKHSKENDSNSPDFVLAGYLESVLEAYNQAVTKRDEWFGVRIWDVADRRKMKSNLNKSLPEN